MVDELRDRINAAATRDASASGTLVLSDYHSNPSLREVQRLLPALKTSLTSLNLSYCLEIHGKPLEDLLTSLPNLRSLDLSCCELQDDGCAVVALAIGAHSNVIQNVSLRANRIGAVGAAALGKALEDEDCTLERLDLGDNELSRGGAEAVRRLLEVNKVITWLGLAKNELDGIDCAGLFADDEPSTTRVFADIGIGDDATTTLELAEALQQDADAPLIVACEADANRCNAAREACAAAGVVVRQTDGACLRLKGPLRRGHKYFARR